MKPETAQFFAKESLKKHNILQDEELDDEESKLHISMENDNKIVELITKPPRTNNFRVYFEKEKETLKKWKKPKIKKPSTPGQQNQNQSTDDIEPEKPNCWQKLMLTE